MREPLRSVLLALLQAVVILVAGGGVMKVSGCSGPAAPPSCPCPPEPKPDDPPDREPGDPLGAIGKISMGNSMCSATVINPPDATGRRTLVTAAHCVDRVGQSVTFVPRNSPRSIPCSVVAIDRKADVCILATAGPHPDLPYLRVANETPPVGTEVMHCGFGRDRPGNVEKGRVTSGILPNGQVRYKLSVSPGDSGGGICLTAKGELLSPVCCTSAFGPAIGDTYGGSPERVREMLAHPTEFFDLPPAVMPPVPVFDGPKEMPTAEAKAGAVPCDAQAAVGTAKYHAAIPVECYAYNRTGVQCVWASLETMARTVGEKRLSNVTADHPGPARPSEVDGLLRAAGVPFASVPPGDRDRCYDFLETHVTKVGRPTAIGVYDGSHCLLVVHFERGRKVVTLGNNVVNGGLREWGWSDFEATMRPDGWAFTLTGLPVKAIPAAQPAPAPRVEYRPARRVFPGPT